MKYLMIPACVVAAGTLAHADTSDEIARMVAEQGLSATEQNLSALPAPDATERFALGGVRFLGAIEHALQVRYDTGINDGLARQSGLPLLRIPLPDNPNAAPFTPDIIENLFADTVSDMAGALEALDTIGEADDVALRIDTSRIWFDINSNGTRDNGEGLLDVVGFALTPQFGGEVEMTDITVQFDTSDAAWLSAYAHLLSGIGEVVLAVDTTQAITDVLETRSTFEDLSPMAPQPGGFISLRELADGVDLFTMFTMAFDHPIDTEHSRAAHAHFLDMLADNRVFWARVAAETDNQMEWIPNDMQTSATGITFPEGLAQSWQAVLADAERLLRGETLMPFWRLGPDAGINIAKVFQDPPTLDLIGTFQGHTVLPYAERGPLITNRSLRDFTELTGGQDLLFMAFLN